MKRTSLLLSIALLAIFGLLAQSAVAALTGAIWTTNSTGTQVNGNIYALNTDVYLSGGPQNTNCGVAGLPNGDYYFQVTDPSGGTLLSTDLIAARKVLVSNGIITGYLGITHATGSGPCGSITVQLMPYAPSSPTGEYKVWMTKVGDYSLTAPGNVHGFLHSKSKTDNFRIRTDPTCAPGFGVFPNCFAAMPVTKTLNGSSVPTDLSGNPLIQFTFNLYLQNPVPVGGQIVPDGYPSRTSPLPAEPLATVNFPPDPGLLAPWGVPLSLCDMGAANASPSNGTGTFGSLTVTWKVTITPPGTVYLDTVNNILVNSAVVGNPYDPSGFITNTPHASCINFIVPAGTAEFRIDVDNIAPNTGWINGNGTIPTNGSGTPAVAGIDVTHQGTILHCNKAKDPNNMKVKWDGQANKFELQTLTFAACLDTILTGSSASFDTYIGVGTGTFNGVTGYTATWRFTDAGNPGTSDQATIIITKDSDSSTVVNLGPANLVQGNQNAHD